MLRQSNALARRSSASQSACLAGARPLSSNVINVSTASTLPRGPLRALRRGDAVDGAVRPPCRKDPAAALDESGRLGDPPLSLGVGMGHAHDRPGIEQLILAQMFDRELCHRQKFLLATVRDNPYPAMSQIILSNDPGHIVGTDHMLASARHLEACPGTIRAKDAKSAIRPFAASSIARSSRSSSKLGRTLRSGSGPDTVPRGRPATRVFTLTRGTLKLYKLLADGRRQVTGFMHPGDFLGISIDDEHAFSAEALEDSQLCWFPRARFDDFVEDHSAMERELYRIAAHELAAAQQQLVLLGRKTCDASASRASCSPLRANRAVERSSGGNGPAANEPVRHRRLPGIDQGDREPCDLGPEAATGSSALRPWTSSRSLIAAALEQLSEAAA